MNSNLDLRHLPKEHLFEEWKIYPLLKKRFAVSNYGRIWSFHKGNILKTSVDKYGYERISVIIGSRTDKTRKHLNLKVHQMIALTFLGKPTVNHKDNNKLNNKIGNLEWCSSSENLKKGWRDGLFENVYRKNKK